MVFQSNWALGLNVYLGQLSSERIQFPNDQRLPVTFVHESAGASHSLGQWLMGFEDMPGGGDRDFNDVVFLLRGAQEGLVRSRVLSQADASCRVAQVAFTRNDVLGTGCDATAAIVDVSGTPGQQLCWEAQVTAGSGVGCLPSILSVDVGSLSEPTVP
ncbi:DUF4114 domain-containing protein [Corallococcus interemptor]|uniref:DUF4114 domain-containing protein n=1 Tax=Corallococcus interemptor TaxID=2316720 RepID=UPI003D0417BE